MTDLEKRLRETLDRQAADMPRGTSQVEHAVRKAIRRRVIVGTTSLLLMAALVTGAVSASSFLDRDSTIPVHQESNGSVEPSAGDSSANPHPSETTNEGQRIAQEFGWGRVPVGAVEICPSGEFISPPKPEDQIFEAVEELMRAANSENPDPSLVWQLMDESLQRANGSFEEFQTRFEKAQVDAVYSDWQISDQAEPQRAEQDDEPLIDVGAVCGNDVRDATWMGGAHFPRFQGVSGGAVQLFFVMRSEGPRLWFAY